MVYLSLFTLPTMAFAYLNYGNLGLYAMLLFVLFAINMMSLSVEVR